VGQGRKRVCVRVYHISAKIIAKPSQAKLAPQGEKTTTSEEIPALLGGVAETRSRG